MNLDLKNKVIVVTGGASGIGTAIVRNCGQEGAFPVIVDRDESAAENLKRQLHAEGVESEVIAVDLCEIGESTRALKDMTNRVGRLDGLVNNAGVNDGVGLEHGSPERFAASFKSNFAHYYTMKEAALPYLIQSKGVIVNISSKVAITGQGGTSGYAAAKGAILGASIEWAAELAEYGIRVNAVIPAEVRTPQYERWLQSFENPEERLRSIEAKIPLHARMTEPEEVAAMVVFLLSPKSAGITGQQLFVDGGYIHLDRALTFANFPGMTR
ncbi:MAG TPA: SDR family oxidoreductase [Terriglobales bacterium]|nr:SDR family oxidoreductase [Terriglobales bacterium]